MDNYTMNYALQNFPHPEGSYTGESWREDGQTWYMVNSVMGAFETTDQPSTAICLSGVAHEEYRVKDRSGVVIFAVSIYPKYYAKAMQERTN